MSNAQSQHGGLQLTLSIWHPDCWTLEVTDKTAAGLLAHGVSSLRSRICWSVCSPRSPTGEATMRRSSARLVLITD